MWQFVHLLHTYDVYAKALVKQLNFLVYGCDKTLYIIMIHNLLSSGATYLRVDSIVDDVIIEVSKIN